MITGIQNSLNTLRGEITMNKEMIHIEGSNSLFVIYKLDNGNYHIKGYLNDDEQRIWWNTERKPDGQSIRKKGSMETGSTYQSLASIARSVIEEYEKIRGSKQ